MSYIALYRKWRPMVFDDLVGQQSISRVLKSQVVNNRIAHAYLFSGGRGTGKTTTAKILSRAVNCVSPEHGNPCNKCEICQGIISGNIMDVVEIDAASNNSVDNVRSIREEVFYTPSVSKYRVYIIDEVHMLSTGAFNALLKILEEPPRHVVFILATTEPHKLPATILSRCQRFEFRQIGDEDIIGRLGIIAKDSGINIDKDALELIAKVSEGALRDAISIFDQCMDSKETVTKQRVIEIIGMPQEETIGAVAKAISDKNIVECISLIDHLMKQGKDINQFVSVLTRFFRDVLVYKSTGSNQAAYMTNSEVCVIKDISSMFSQSRLINIITSLSELESNMRWASLPRVMVEVEIIRLCRGDYEAIDGAIEERLAKLEALVSQPMQNHNIKVESKVQTTSTPTKVEKPKAKPVSDTGGSGSFQEWERVVTELKSSGKVVLYANLIGTRAVILDSMTVGIVFSKSAGNFGKTVVSKNENLAILKAAIKKVTGEDMGIKCIIDGNDIGVTKEKPSEGCVNKVAEIAKEFDIPINIIEE